MSESTSKPSQPAAPDPNWAFLYLREDIQELRQDQRQHHQETRQEFQELRGEFQELRQEVLHQIEGVRSEFRQDIQSVRHDLRQDTQSVRHEVQALHKRLDTRFAVLLATVVGMSGMLAGLIKL